jgi:hypothetical protein
MNEFAHPRLPITRKLRRSVVAVQDMFSRPKADSSRRSEGGLQFIYDLAVSPLTFDFVSYLAAAELSRRRAGLSHIDVVFVAGQHFGVRKELPEYDSAIDATARLWRLRNILIPILAQLPSVRSHVWCGAREQAAEIVTSDGARIYPTDYRLNLPCQPIKSRIHDMVRSGDNLWPMLRATDASKRYVAAFLEAVASGRRPVVISLRNYGFAPGRNSCTANWMRFADGLDQTRYAPIFVPDTESAIAMNSGDLGGHPICLAACWNLEIRMALYEAAWLNMGVMHGPLELCWYNEAVRYAIFIPAGTDAVNSVDALTEHGHRIGADHDFATPFQRIVWERDDLSCIEAAFAAMAPLLPERVVTAPVPEVNPP